jgi:hypothetical protein
MNKLIWLVVILSFIAGLQAVTIARLEHEKEVYDWKYFTAKTLLDDPATRAIMCAKGGKRMN